MNGTVSNTTVAERPPSDTEQIPTKYAVLYVIGVIALVGNTLIITVILKTKSLRKSINFFILNMAVSDMFVPLTSIPLYLLVVAEQWPATGRTGDALCKIAVFISEISDPVSVLSLIFMSYDRFVAVVFPLRQVSSITRFRLIAATWVISSLFFSPIFYGLKVVERPNDKESCFFDWSPLGRKDRKLAKTTYQMLRAVLFTAIPCIVLTALYTGIFVKLYKQDKTLDATQTSQIAIRRRKQARQIVKLSFVIVLSFGVCHAPENVVIFAFQAFHFKWISNPGKTWQTWKLVAKCFALSSAAANPIVCFIFCEKLREGLLKLVKLKRNAKNVRNRKCGNETLELRARENVETRIIASNLAD